MAFMLFDERTLMRRRLAAIVDHRKRAVPEKLRLSHAREHTLFCASVVGALQYVRRAQHVFAPCALTLRRLGRSKLAISRA